MTTTNGHSTAQAKELGREQRELECKLDDNELRARGDAMAEAELEIETLKEHRKGINGKIADLSTTRAKLAEVIDARMEKRMVSCAWIEDLPQNKKNLVRQDTGAHIDVRALTVDELQGTLALGAGEPANDNGERPADEGDDDDSPDIDERGDTSSDPAEADTDESEKPAPQQAKVLGIFGGSDPKKTARGKAKQAAAKAPKGKAKGKSSKHTRHIHA